LFFVMRIAARMPATATEAVPNITTRDKSVLLCSPY